MQTVKYFPVFSKNDSTVRTIGLNWQEELGCKVTEINVDL